MQNEVKFDGWSAGHNYEHYMGRWSSEIAARFIGWLDPPERADWLEIGCGTGALTRTVMGACAPRSMLATDSSADFVTHARAAIPDPAARFETADAGQLPGRDGSVDLVVSGLVLNFLPDRPAALQEMRRILRPEGVLAFYVWDYPGGGVGFIDAFWKAAAQLDSAAADLDEGIRFPFCNAPDLRALCQAAGLGDVQVHPIEIETEFPDFETYWHPFTLGTGPAPGYCVSLPPDHRLRLKQVLADRFGQGAPIRLPARAWAVRALRG